MLDANLEREHVIPKNLYPSSKANSKVQRLTVYACHQCNNGWADDEAHFRNMLIIAGEPNDSVREIWATTMRRSFDEIDSGREFAYSPTTPSENQLVVCKPHGSLNMVVNSTSFAFGQPDWLGMPESAGFRSYSGLIPPRFNKTYKQHPIAQMILSPAFSRSPDLIVMWGVGLASSDVDLLELYSSWATHSHELHIVNPSTDVASRASEIFSCGVRHFPSVPEWVDAIS